MPSLSQTPVSGQALHEINKNYIIITAVKNVSGVGCDLDDWNSSQGLALNTTPMFLTAAEVFVL